MKKKNRKTIELSPRDSYFIWAAVCKTGTGVSHRIKKDLFDMTTREQRQSFINKYKK
jgi:hypothetical protein